MLNILAGLDLPSAGTVIVDNQAIEGRARPRGDFQTHALPWRSVMGNVSYAVSSNGASEGPAVRERAQFIDLVGLTGRSKRPAELSVV